MDQHFFRVAFASSGDKATVPDGVQGDGSVSYAEGYGPDYQLDPATDPSAKVMPRDQDNQLKFDLTGAVQQYQVFGTPEWITSANNNGSAYSYSQAARVRYQPGGTGNWYVYVSLVNGNTSEPTDLTKWLRLAPNGIWGGTSGGAANVQTLTPDTPLLSYGAILAANAPAVFEFIWGFTNTTALTLNVSALGAKNVFVNGPSGVIACTGGEAIVGNVAQVRYDGTQFILLNPAVPHVGSVAFTGSSSGVVTVKPGAAGAGTFNFNLPITAGTSGGPLLSGGGGATAMTWGTVTGTGSVFVLAASPTFTGTLTAAAITASGLVSLPGTAALKFSGSARIAGTIDPTGIDALAANFNLVFNTNPGVNEPTSSRNDTTFGFGYNIAANGTRQNVAEPSLSLNWENCFAQGGVLAMEWHLSFIGTSGGEQRPISGFFPRDGNPGDSKMNIATDWLNFIDWSGTSRILIDFNNNLFEMLEDITLRYENNNVPIIAQKNAAASAFINAAYLTDGDYWQHTNAQYFVGVAGTTPLGTTSMLALLETGGALTTGGSIVQGLAGTVTGDLYGDFWDATVSGIFRSRIGNMSTTGKTFYTALVTGSGDLGSEYSVGGGASWILGIDNSDSDAFKIQATDAATSFSTAALRIDAVTSAAVFTGGVTALQLATTGVISSPAWTTAGLRVVVGATTLTDSSSSGTVATTNVDLFGAATIAAASATTFTTVRGVRFEDPIAGSLATFTRSFAISAPTVSFGGGTKSAPNWSTFGIRMQMAAGTYTDTSSSGTVAFMTADIFRGCVFTSSNSVTYTDAYTTYINSCSASGPASITNAWALGVDSAKVNGALTTTGLATLAGATVVSGSALTLGNAAVTGLVAGALAALTNATVVIKDSTGQSYRIPCII